MKIYNKKKFASGVFLLLLGLVRFTPLFAGREWDVKGVFWTAVALLLGVSELVHSLSYTLTKKDRLEELDERNRLVDWKTKSMTLKITRYVCLVLGWIFAIIGVIREADIVVALGLGLLFTFPIGMFAELFTGIYYESKN